jgi:glutamate racemase
VFRSIRDALPQYDYLYLGDNARAPYGNRSFETVYQYTRECVQWFFDQGCPLVILACNTASAKALRSIQQRWLPHYAPDKRVLGVIRPTAEVVGQYTKTGVVGVMGTAGTVASESYPIEISKFFPQVKVYQQACPLLVPLVENGEYDSPGADFFVKKYTDALLAQSEAVDTVLLACTHYPLLEKKIRACLPSHIRLIAQGEIVARSLEDYLRRHPEMETRITKNGEMRFFTTDDPADFERHAAVFFGAPVQAEHLSL